MTEPSQYFKGRTVQEQMNEVIGYVDVRSAEVATDAIAADVAQVHSDAADAHADALAAAASAAAAAGTLANAVKKTGEVSQSIAGDIAVSGDLDVGGDADITGALDVTGAITGNDASLIGTVTVPTEATGTFTMKAANSTKVKNELDNYALMVRTTGNQPIAGIKLLAQAVSLPVGVRTASGTKTAILTLTVSPSTYYRFDMIIANKRGVGLGRLEIVTDASGNISSVTWYEAAKTAVMKCAIGAYTDGTTMTVTIAGTEGGSYNAVTLLGAIGGDGYVMNPTLQTRQQVTPGADYAEAVLG